MATELPNDPDYQPSRAEILLYWIRLLPSIRRLNLDMRYRPYFGKPPETDPNKLVEVNKVNINLLEDGDVVSVDPFYVRPGDKGYHGHPNAMYTIEVKGSGRNKSLRIWRGLPHDLDGAIGQSLTVKAREFIRDQESFHNKPPEYLMVDKHIMMPFFREGEGPQGFVRPPEKLDFWYNGIGTLKLQKADKNKK